MHWDQEFHGRIRAGTIYSAAALKALSSTGGVRPSIETRFSEPPGLNESVSLQSIGGYVALDGYQGDYRLGGRGMFGGSWQQNLGGREVRYAKVEAAIEGRLPIASERSVLIGLASADMLREDSGTTEIPFYLYPRIGGSATLRGFPLDRFYGRNAIFTTLEYRWLLNPNVEAQFFLASGQIFQNTNKLRFLDWYRNYGFGIAFRTATGTAFRIEVGSGDEGFSWHITFGARPIRPFGSGPVRYPTYRP